LSDLNSYKYFQALVIVTFSVD